MERRERMLIPSVDWFLSLWSNGLMFHFTIDINIDIEPMCITSDEWEKREPASILNEIAKSAIFIEGAA